MPRVFNSLAEAETSVQGYKGRNAYAAAQRAARQAHLNSPEAKARAAHLRHVNEDHALRRVIVAAEDHAALLRRKLDAARRQAAFMAENAYRTGDISSNTDKIRSQIEGLPDLIARAERELADARAALTAHRAQAPQAETAAEPAESVEAAPQPEPEPIAEAPRGRGRPKVVK